MKEQAVTFSVDNQELMAILHSGSSQCSTGVIIVVGGPQYRIGSHRQFVQLSRALAEQGVSSMRFDSTGMGDSGGNKKEFDNIDHDIRGAINLFVSSQTFIKRVIIWGLCDAASAALMYAHQDERVAGLVMLNPWLRSEKAKGKAMIKYYYLNRMLSKSFWKKLLTGKVNIAASTRDAKGFVKDSVGSNNHNSEGYQHLMLSGLQAFEGRVCLILSGEDLTAREFDLQTKANKAWSKLRCNDNEIHYLADADHTFSSMIYKKQVEDITINFLKTKF